VTVEPVDTEPIEAVPLLITAGLYQQAINDLSNRSGRAALLAMRLRLPLVERIARAVRFILAANDSATILGDAFTSWQLRQEPLGLVRPDDEEQRLTDALTSVFEPVGQELSRVERIARTEPMTSARLASVDVMVKHKITRYRWQLDAEPCTYCKARAVATHPIEEPPKTHPNCGCVVVPTTERLK